MSLKEKASEDGGRVVYRRAQKGGMERLHKHLYMCSVHVSRRKEKMMLCMQDFLTDISDRAATVTHAHMQEKNIHKMRHLVRFFSPFGHNRSQDIPGAKCTDVLQLFVLS